MKAIKAIGIFCLIWIALGSVILLLGKVVHIPFFAEICAQVDADIRVPDGSSTENQEIVESVIAKTSEISTSVSKSNTDKTEKKEEKDEITVATYCDDYATNRLMSGYNYFFPDKKVTSKNIRSCKKNANGYVTSVDIGDCTVGVHYLEDSGPSYDIFCYMEYNDENKAHFAEEVHDLLLGYGFDESSISTILKNTLFNDVRRDDNFRQFYTYNGYHIGYDVEDLYFGFRKL